VSKGIPFSQWFVGRTDDVSEGTERPGSVGEPARTARELSGRAAPWGRYQGQVCPAPEPAAPFSHQQQQMGAPAVNSIMAANCTRRSSGLIHSFMFFTSCADEAARPHPPPGPAPAPAPALAEQAHAHGSADSGLSNIAAENSAVRTSGLIHSFMRSPLSLVRPSDSIAGAGAGAGVRTTQARAGHLQEHLRSEVETPDFRRVP
jgi:hypothetical protein